jgi:hypothetical protein
MPCISSRALPSPSPAAASSLAPAIRRRSDDAAIEPPRRPRQPGLPSAPAPRPRRFLVRPRLPRRCGVTDVVPALGLRRRLAMARVVGAAAASFAGASAAALRARLRFRGRTLLQYDGQLVGARQVLERAEAEMLEELLRGAVQQSGGQGLRLGRPARRGAIDECAQHAADPTPRMSSTSATDRLAVGDDREHLERRRRQACRLRHRIVALEDDRIFRARQDLVAARHS